MHLDVMVLDVHVPDVAGIDAAGRIALPVVLSSPGSRLSAFMAASPGDGRGDADPRRSGRFSDLRQRFTLRPA